MPRALRSSPVSVRLSETERNVLTRRAGSLGLSTYIKSVLFSGAAPQGKARRATADQVLLAHILAQLGTSGLAQDMRRLSEAAHSGSLDLDDLTVLRLHEACKDIQGIHVLLLQALGKRPPPTVRDAQKDFLRAVSGPEGTP